MIRIELSDLPPRLRAQAEQQLLAQRKKRDPLLQAVQSAKKVGRQFDSKGECDYYFGTILPKIKSGEIRECIQHPRFELFPAGQYGDRKLNAIRYTADFRIDYADGRVEIVEIKSKFVKRMQRDYHIRVRVFVETIARPQGWLFTEVITEDSADEIKCWKELAKSVELSSKEVDGK